MTTLRVVAFAISGMALLEFGFAHFLAMHALYCEPLDVKGRAAAAAATGLSLLCGFIGFICFMETLGP